MGECRQIFFGIREKIEVLGCPKMVASLAYYIQINQDVLY